MKSRFLKAVSVLISLCLLISATGLCAAFAVNGKRNVLVFVNGMGASALYENLGEENERPVYPASDEATAQLVGAVVPSVISYLVHKDADRLSDEILPAVLEYFEPLACNPDGTSKYNVSVNKTPGNISNYPNLTGEDCVKSEWGILRTAAEKLGAENVYVFSYDWRLSTLDHVVELKEYVERAKAETGAQKVVLVGGSMGGAIVSSYFATYGSADISHLIMLSSAFMGVSLVGELFTGNVSIDAEALVDEITQLDMDASLSKLLSAVLPALEKAGVLDAVLSVADEYLASQKDRIYDEVFKETFVTIPSVWELLPLSYYENAKAYLLDSEADAQLIARADKYHYEVQARFKTLLDRAQSDGMMFSAVSHYNMQGVAATPNCRNHTDNLIDTVYTGGLPTCALMGEILPENYTAANPVCTDVSHSHISPDRIIDASTCFAPESTWFVKNVDHMGYKYGTDLMDLVMWLISAQNQPTVYKSELYPQFIVSDLSGKIYRESGGESTTDVPDTTKPSTEPSESATEVEASSRPDENGSTPGGIPGTDVKSTTAIASLAVLSVGATAVLAVRMRKKEQ